MLEKNKPTVCDKLGICDIANAKMVSRATWICPLCGKDISLHFLFYMQAKHPEWSESNGN